MQSSQLTALQNAKLLLEQCGCFRGPPGPTGPEGPQGPAGKTLFYYSDGMTNDPNAGNIDGCVYGLFIGADGTIWRSQATTQIDSSFTASYLNGSVNTITKQSDGKIVVGGTFTLYGASSYNCIIRFNSDGTVDSSFSIGTGFNNSVETIVLQSDGKILVGGAFTTYNGNAYKNLVRLNSDGSLDTGFYSTPGFDNTVYSIAIQSDGKIVVGGQFENYDSFQSYKLIRLTSAGFYDTSFPVDTGFDGVVYSVVLDSENNVYVGGNFSSYKSSVISNGLVRILNDATLDTSTFLTGTGVVGTVYFMRFMNSSTLLITGSLSSYNGTSINNLAEVSINGTLTNTFGSGINGDVNTATVDLSSNYLFGGNFSSYNGTTVPNNIVRITSLGNVDTTYPFVVGFNNTVNSIYVENYSQVLVGGDFTQYNNSTTSYLTRLQEKPCAWINTGTNILGASSNYSTVTNALVSTVAGLGNAGYISSSQLISTVTGLGSIGYVSSSQLVSSVAGVTNFISSYISSSQLTSTVIGIAFSSFVSSINLNREFSSTINGLGNLGYVSTSQLVSTVKGLGTVGYVSSTQLASTVAGLSLVGYISSSQLVSTVVNLARLGYVSSTQLASTVTGLGTVRYVSSSQLTSTVRGLGTVGYVSTASLFSSIQSYNFVSTQSLVSSLTGLGSLGYISSGTSMQSNLTSTVVGLGTVGYVSTASLTSSLTGLGSLGYISSAGSLQAGLTSTVVGLGTVGYVSSQSLYSTIESYKFISTQSLTSSLTGLGSLGYISSAGSLQAGLTSSIIGLGTVGYVSTASLTSSLTGLGSLGYISSAGASQTAITSSIIGLGTVGYVSSQSLYSTIESYNFISTQSLTSSLTGLGSLGYISSAGSLQAGLTSSIIGLGTVGYVSTQSLTSTVTGLGSLGYISSAGASQAGLTSSIIGLGTVGYISSFNSISSLNISTGNLFANIINSSTVINTDGIFTISLSTGQTISRLINSSTISTSVLLGDRIIGTSNNGIYVNNIYPFSAGAQLGFGSALTGFYSAVFAQSTVTNSLTADFGNPNSNIAVTGNIIPAFSSFTNASLGNNTNRWVNIFNNNLVVSTISTFLSSITVSANFIPSRDNQFTLGTSTLRWRSLFVGPSSIYVGDIAEINANDSGVLTTNVGFEIPQLNVSSISSGGVAVFTNISSLVYGGIESYQYISTTGLQSTITGLGTLGYISSAGSLQAGLTSSIIGLGTVGYVSTQSLYSTIESYNFISTTTLQSSITGLGSIGYISSSQLQSTITAPRTMIIQTFNF